MDEGGGVGSMVALVRSGRDEWRAGLGNKLRAFCKEFLSLQLRRYPRSCIRASIPFPDDAREEEE
jgi:hypothetical protein